MKTILVTGAAGFIGHRTCEVLLDDGYCVIGVDNLNDYYDVSLKQHRLSLLEDRENFTFYKVDIENKPALEDIFEKNTIDSVMNLAARAGVRYSIENPHIYVSTNISGCLNVLECMRENGIKKFLLASTSSLYAGQKMPFIETLPVNEPISPYAATKKAAEAMAYTYHHLHGFDVSIVRYFTVYGPLSRPDMAYHKFSKAILNGDEIEVYGDGTQSRDFTHVDDIARGNVLALKNVGFEVINLGNGNKPISVNQIISAMEQKFEKKATIKYLDFNSADMKSTWADITKASRLLGWKPHTSIFNAIETDFSSVGR